MDGGRGRRARETKFRANNHKRHWLEEKKKKERKTVRCARQRTSKETEEETRVDHVPLGESSSSLPTPFFPLPSLHPPRTAAVVEADEEKTNPNGVSNSTSSLSLSGWRLASTVDGRGAKMCVIELCSCRCFFFSRLRRGLEMEPLVEASWPPYVAFKAKSLQRRRRSGLRYSVARCLRGCEVLKTSDEESVEEGR